MIRFNAPIPLVLIAFGTASCVSSGFRSSVAEFGELTELAAGAQNESLRLIIDDEKERIASELASERVDLILVTPDCLPAPAGGAKPCSVKRRDGKPLEKASDFKHILILGARLEDYAANLVDLSRDATEDKEAFSRSLASAASSIAKLDSAVRDAAKIEKDSSVAPRLGAIATVAASLGNLYFDHRRAKALKGIIIEADPAVKEASALLQKAYSIDRLYKQTGMLQLVQDAERRTRLLIANPNSSAGQIRDAQDRLFRTINEFNRASKGEDRFDAVGKAHAELAEAARQGASAEELLQVAKALFALAETISTELPNLKK